MKKIYQKLFFDIVLKNDKDYELFSVQKCLNCSFVYFTPFPDDYEIEMKYRQLAEIPKSDNKPDHQKTIRIKERQGFICDLIKSMPEFTNNSKILEYGGLGGDMIQPLANKTNVLLLTML